MIGRSPWTLGLNRSILIAGALALLGMPVVAESPVGVWLTPPDKKGQVAHIVARPCGGALCGTIERVFGPDGAPIRSAALGVRVFWDMRPEGDSYEGRAYVPAHKREYSAKMRLRGDELKVSGCLGPVCQAQTWVRVE